MAMAIPTQYFDPVYGGAGVGTGGPIYPATAVGGIRRPGGVGTAAQPVYPIGGIKN